MNPAKHKSPDPRYPFRGPFPDSWTAHYLTPRKDRRRFTEHVAAERILAPAPRDLRS